VAGTSNQSGRDDESLRRGVSGTAGAAASLRELAEAALAVLAGTGTHVADQDGDGWQARVDKADGPPLELVCRGPDLPVTVPEGIAPPGLIPTQRPWAGTHRLVVTAPLIVFDLYWTPGQPLRIMTFSRGDWEAVLLGRSRGLFRDTGLVLGLDDGNSAGTLRTDPLQRTPKRPDLR